MQAFKLAGPLQRALPLCAQALIAQVSQTAACDRHRSVEQQPSRWRLSTQGRLLT